MGIKWERSPEVLIEGMANYEQRATAAALKLLDLFAPMVESYAKANKPWTDRTGNARQTLFSVTDVAHDVVKLYLSHGMEYGKWLELCNSGRYAIVMPTLQAHYGQIMAALNDLFRD